MLPATAFGASVEVKEQTTEPIRRAQLTFTAAPGEGNELTVSVAGEEGAYYDLRLLDSAVAIEPGAGCSGGGAPGVAVECKVHKPHPGEHYTCFKGCFYTAGTRWELSMRFNLGDGGSSFDGTAIPASANDPLQWWAPSVPIPVTVAPGAGDDTVRTADGPDLVEASPGDDFIRTAKGNDLFRGGPAPDGADDVDLGADNDTLDYGQRTSDVRIDPNGLADDGAPGEGDNLAAAETVTSGAGNDILVGVSTAASAWYENSLAGGAGDDTIRGGAGADQIAGGSGNDELFGEGGDDVIGDPASYGGKGPSGDDVAGGGDGDDTITMAGGKDRAYGDGGRDTIRLGAGADRIAAGMVAYGAWEGRRFLHQSGPLEARPDRVDCGGEGGDGATLGAGDTAVGCELTPRAAMMEAIRFEPADRFRAAHFYLVLRRPGVATLSSPGLKRTELRSRKRDFYSWGIAVQPVGRTLAKLERDGEATVRVTIVFHAVSGAEQVLRRTVRLESPVELTSHRRV
jgi:Ca2+-binding RTX toxin-like protein